MDLGGGGKGGSGVSTYREIKQSFFEGIMPNVFFYNFFFIIFWCVMYVHT